MARAIADSSAGVVELVEHVAVALRSGDVTE